MMPSISLGSNRLGTRRSLLVAIGRMPLRLIPDPLIHRRRHFKLAIRQDQRHPARQIHRRDSFKRLRNSRTSKPLHRLTASEQYQVHLQRLHRRQQPLLPRPAVFKINRKRVHLILFQ
jgi:hypothetical protein